MIYKGEIMALLNRDEVIEALNAEIDFSIESDYDLTKIKPEFQKFADEMIKAQEKAINELEPASDAVPVVRCKNCKHWDSISRQSVSYIIKSHIHEIITESGIDKNAHTNAVLRAILNLVETMPPVTSTQKWILTSERQPKENGNYLALYRTSDGTYNFEFMMVDHCNAGGGWLHEENGRKTYKKVIAWMPLPEIYSEVEE